MLSTQLSFAAGDHAPRADLSALQRWLLTAGAVLLHGLMAIAVWHASSVPAIPPEPAPMMVSLINEVVQAPPPTPPVVEPPKPETPKPVITPPKREPTVVASSKAPSPQDMVVPAAPPPPAPVPPPVQAAAPTAAVPTAPEPAPLPPPKVLPSSAVGYLIEPKLVFPAASLELGESGVVTVEVLVDAEGRVKEVTVTKSSGYPRLDRAGVNAMKSARFRPYILNGVPQSIRATAPLNFSLEP